MASIAWDVDASDGGESLSSPRAAQAGRFFEFVPDIQIVGPRRTTLGDRLQHTFAMRTDYTARLQIRHLPPSSMASALALKLWLLSGGEVTVTTSDADSATYTGLTLRPGTTPEIEPLDEGRQHFGFRCELASDDPILVDYSA